MIRGYRMAHFHLRRRCRGLAVDDQSFSGFPNDAVDAKCGQESRLFLQSGTPSREDFLLSDFRCGQTEFSGNLLNGGFTVDEVHRSSVMRLG